MKPFIRDLIADLKAAVLIGEERSLATALERIRAAAADQIPPQALSLLGEALADLPPGRILPLLGDSDAAVRGIGAAAAALSLPQNPNFPLEALLYAADDPSPEVRRAFAGALGRTVDDPAGLAASWLLSESPHVRQTALRLLAVTKQRSDEIFDRMAPLDSEPDHELRNTLVETLNVLAETGAAAHILRLLEKWSARSEPNVWVITRALSASWAGAHSQEALRILGQLAETVGEIRPVLRAIEQLER